mgnify:CR=1 FL=1
MNDVPVIAKVTAAPVLTPIVRIRDVSIVEIPELTGVTEEIPAPKLRIVAADPTADRVVTIPNVTGTIITTGDTGTVTDAMLSGGTALTSAEKTKLTNIEIAATADQTNDEIRTAVESATNSNVFTDADHTKLNNIEENATARVNAPSNSLILEVNLPAIN